MIRMRSRTGKVSGKPCVFQRMIERIVVKATYAIVDIKKVIDFWLCITDETNTLASPDKGVICLSKLRPQITHFLYLIKYIWQNHAHQINLVVAKVVVKIYTIF